MSDSVTSNQIHQQVLDFIFAPCAGNFVLRYSLSLSGAISPSVSSSSTPGSQASRLLAEYDAVVVTDATLAACDPTLLSSEPSAKQPLRVILARSLAFLTPTANVFLTANQAPTLVITDEASVAEDVRLSAAGAELQGETWLSEMGCDVVVLPNEYDPESVVSVLEQRGVNSMLWDCAGVAPESSAASSGDDKVPAFLAPWLLDDEAVHKVVVTVTGETGERNASNGASAVINGLQSIKGMMCYKTGNDIVVEGYM